MTHFICWFLFMLANCHTIRLIQGKFISKLIGWYSFMLKMQYFVEEENTVVIYCIKYPVTRYEYVLVIETGFWHIFANSYIFSFLFVKKILMFKMHWSTAVKILINMQQNTTKDRNNFLDIRKSDFIIAELIKFKMAYCLDHWSYYLLFNISFIKIFVVFEKRMIQCSIILSLNHLTNKMLQKSNTVYI